MRKVDLSIIIPAKNEGERIAKTLDQLALYLKKHDHGFVEVIAVIAGNDNTAEIANSKRPLFDNLQIIKKNTPGKGNGVKTGMLRAHGEYRLFMDADLATPLHHLESVKQHQKGGSDVIIGVRNLTKSHKGLRKFISSFGNILVRVFLGLRVPDTQCGFKAFRAEVAEDLFSKLTIVSWGFDMEMLAVAKHRGYSIVQIPINDWQDVAGGTFNNVAVTGAVSTFKDLLKIKWNLIRGKYKRGQPKH